jgi:hypothetical protein
MFPDLTDRVRNWYRRGCGSFFLDGRQDAIDCRVGDEGPGCVVDQQDLGLGGRFYSNGGTGSSGFSSWDYEGCLWG